MQSTVRTMRQESDPVELVGRQPDERLLSEHLARLPESVGRPEAPTPLPARGRLVAVGATLTGVTLVAGLGLLVLGVILAVSDGLRLPSILALVAGVVLVSTHWGWVHVAEATADGLEQRHNAGTMERQRLWLQEIEPYPRWEVTTSAGEDGSVTISTIAYRPVAGGERTFTFIREIAGTEVHSGEEPAAAVAERAELMRRRAAADTTRARERWATADDAYQRALMDADDERQRVAALRAASQALSEQINANLRDPPLTE